MKRAFIVTFEVATRVVIDTDKPDYEKLMCEKALKKIARNIDGYLCDPDIEEDTEEPYDPKYDE